MESIALLNSVSPKTPDKPIRALGIDLGTTNSTVAEATWDPGDGERLTVRCLEIEQFTFEGVYTHVLIPSIVALHAGEVIVGEGAKRLRSRAPDYDLEQNKNLFYECKNDIGTKRTYHRAPESFRSASEIGGHVLRFLHQSALDEDPASVDRVVVTVPASFQAAQRYDTLKAAELAGLDVSGGALLDEPVAAFLDYLVTRGSAIVDDLVKAKRPKTLVVFDFGGGTCDIAVFRVGMDSKKSGVKVESLSVSRYHRLGGGDIDAAILHDIILPQLLEQNGLSEFDLGFQEKKKVIEPAFLGLAEALKISLCSEITRLRRFGQYDDADKSEVSSKQPGIHTCKLKDRELTLQSPQITAEEFEAVLEPFLDQDLLYARETEYRMTCSIFAPLQDALDRCGLDAKEVDYCLMVGGSSLIPQVVDAVDGYFGRAQLLTYPDRDSIQTAIARGAAYHALALAAFGKGLIQPVCHDSIAVRTGSGLFELVPQGAELPYPSDGAYLCSQDLAVPRTSLVEPVELRVELVAGEEERTLYSEVWDIPAPVSKGDCLSLEYRFDENQILDLRLSLTDGSMSAAEAFSTKVENPLTNVVNPESKRLEIDELEENLRTGAIAKHLIPYKLVELAEAYAELGQHEKAIDYLRTSMRGQSGPDAYVINKMAMYCGRLGDLEREEKLYREAAKASAWEGPWFNLALLQRRRRKTSDAIESVEKAIEADPLAPYLVLRALLALDADDSDTHAKYLERSLKAFGPPSSLSDWELGWLITAAEQSDDPGLADKAKAEQRKRQKSGARIDADKGFLPDLNTGHGLRRSGK